MASLRELRTGDEVLAETLRLEPRLVAAYLEAVGDAPSSGEGGSEPGVPPLGVVALALRRLLERVELPDGTVHTGQMVRAAATVSPGESLPMRWSVSRASSRAGSLFVNLDLRVERADAPVVEARVSLVVAGGQG